MPMPAAKNLAGAAVTALIKSDPSALAIAGGKEAIEWLFNELSGGEKSKLDQLIGQIEADLERLAKTEFKGRADLDPAVGNATTLFEGFGLSATDLVDVGLVPARATEALLERGVSIVGRYPHQREGAIALCCDRIVPRVHELLLNDPAFIASLQPAIARALLAQREQIRDLPDKVGAALRDTFGRYLAATTPSASGPCRPSC
jgi:hypothetical protein